MHRTHNQPMCFLWFSVMAFAIAAIQEASMGASHMHEPPLSAVDLRVEYIQTPAIGIQVRKPRFSWAIRQRIGERGTLQSAYQVKVVDVGNQTVVWESGKTISNRTIGIKCGVNLESDNDYYFSVTWSDQNGNDAASANATFTTGLLDPSNVLW